MGVAGPKVKRASKMHLLSLLPLLCIVSAAPEGGLFGLGLLGGDSTTNTTTTTAAPSTTPSATTSTTPSATTTTALVEALTTTTASSSSSDTSGIIQNLVPSPLSDPIGFLTHPLISPIILAAVTINPP